MRRNGTIAAVVAAAGLLGAVQIHIIDVQPTATVRLLVVVALAIIVLVSLGVAWLHPTPPPASVERLGEYPALGGRRPWSVLRRATVVTIASGRSTRRDARVETEYLVRNRSRSSIGSIEVPMTGDTLLKAGDLEVMTQVDDGESMLGRVSFSNDFSPVVTFRLPAPGLSPGEVVRCRMRYLWPALAHIGSESWIINLRHARRGAAIAITLHYELEDAQVAEARIVRRMAGIRWEVVHGALKPVSSAKRSTIHLRYTKRRGDEFLRVVTERRLDPDMT